MNTIDLRLTEHAALTVAPRPKAVATGIVGSWLATSRLSMTVPAFHDRRPLCST